MEIPNYVEDSKIELSILQNEIARRGNFPALKPVFEEIQKLAITSADSKGDVSLIACLKNLDSTASSSQSVSIHIRSIFNEVLGKGNSVTK